MFPFCFRLISCPYFIAKQSWIVITYLAVLTAHGSAYRYFFSSLTKNQAFLTSVCPRLVACSVLAVLISPAVTRALGTWGSSLHMCLSCVEIAALPNRVSVDCVGNLDNCSLGQGRITDMKLIFMPVLPRCGDWQVPNQLKGKLCVCCWEEQNWGFHWVWEGFRSLFAVFTMFLKHLAGEWKHKSME